MNEKILSEVVSKPIADSPTVESIAQYMLHSLPEASVSGMSPIAAIKPYNVIRLMPQSG
jgi:hypothetical protein